MTTIPKSNSFIIKRGWGNRGGRSSYIDAIVLRQKDDNSGWANAADGVLEQRYY